MEATDATLAKRLEDLGARNHALDEEQQALATVFREQAPTKETLTQLAAHCAEFLVHAVDVEGKQSGVEADLVRMLGEWSPLPVTYAGGARSLADLELVSELGRGRVDLAIGSALDIFGGKLPYKDVVQWDHEARGL